MKGAFKAVILQSTGANSIIDQEVMQDLWSGYGKILCMCIAGCPTGSVVVKYIQLEGARQHPRGLNTDIRHQRKLRSYDVETEWRFLYRVAWADFHRFLKGWSPGHWKINSYSERITEEVINNLLYETTTP